MLLPFYQMDFLQIQKKNNIHISLYLFTYNHSQFYVQSAIACLCRFRKVNKNITIFIMKILIQDFHNPFLVLYCTTTFRHYYEVYKYMIPFLILPITIQL